VTSVSKRQTANSKAGESEPATTYHLVAAAYYRDCDATAAYVPEAFASDGFIHCTDGAQNVADVANRYYKDDRRMYIALVIERARIEPEVRYEDPARIYPHIYGALNRDAIVSIVPLLREADGTFLAPRE
jgi:uncharacterized protein (DUF952 family)